MSSLVFDTHAFVKGAMETGLSDKQAEFLASSYQELLTVRVATKDDIGRLEKEIISLAVRGATKDDIERLEKEIIRLENTMWQIAKLLIGVMVALFGGFAVLLQYIV